MTTNVPPPSTPNIDVQEHHAWTMPGPIGLLGIVVTVGLIAPGIHQTQAKNLPLGPILIRVGTVLLAVLTSGLCILSPSGAKMLEFLGSYVGTVRKPGL